MTTCSAYIYSPLFARDSRPVKALLLAVMLLEGAQSGMNAWNLVHYATLQTRDAGTLFYLTRLDCYSTLLLAVEGALVHTFLAYRCSQLFVSAKVRWLYQLVVAFLTTVSLAGACTYLVYSLELRHGTLKTIGPLNTAVGLWLWGTALVCLATTLGLAHSLSNRAPGLAPQDSGLARLWRVAMDISLPSTFAAVMGAVLSYFLSPATAEYASSGAFFQPLCSFFALSLLSTLAHRDYREPVMASVASLTSTTLWEYGEKGNFTVPSYRQAVVDDDQFADRRAKRERSHANLESMMSSGRLHDAYGSEKKGEPMFM